MLLMVGIVMGAEVVAGIVDTQMLVESKYSVITCVQASWLKQIRVAADRPGRPAFEVAGHC